MSDKYRLPDYEESLEPPPQYSVTESNSTDPARTQCAPSHDPARSQQSTVTVDISSGVFHRGARFDEFSKPSIPPPPPGCPPNHLQQIQMEKGQLNVVLSNTRQQHYENHAFEDTDS